MLKETIWITTEYGTKTTRTLPYNDHPELIDATTVKVIGELPQDCYALFKDYCLDELDLSEATAEHVNDMEEMFAELRVKHLDLSGLLTPKVAHADRLFMDSRIDTLIVGSMASPELKSMAEMFTGLTAVTLDVSRLNTGGIETMEEMFQGVDAEALHLSSRNVPPVSVEMGIECAPEATAILSSFDLSACKNINNLYHGTCIAEIKSDPYSDDEVSQLLTL